jgi:type II secretory pathway pseudopilin PulG
MAALLVTIAVMAVLMSAALPVWRHEAQREKESELVWRGLQYVRAIRLFQAKTGGFPPSIDALVQGRYLRRKYKDPITNDDFLVLNAGRPVPDQAGQSARPGQPPQPGPTQQPTVMGGGVIGVVSKSKAESIREYQGHTHYNEWTFMFVGAAPGRGTGPLNPVPGLPGRGGRGRAATPDGRNPGGRNPGGGRNPFGRPRGIGRPGGGGAAPFPVRSGG